MTRVLLIEDEETISNMYSTILQAKQHQTLQAFNGADGVAMAEAENPDVILLDYRLPDMNGLEIIEKLKQHPELKNVPIVVFSNFVNEADKDIFLTKGAAKVLFKYEMTPTQLIEKIQEYL